LGKQYKAKAMGAESTNRIIKACLSRIVNTTPMMAIKAGNKMNNKRNGITVN